MAIDKVQLKQENIVGDNVVLEDINPKSSTPSINDPSTGYSLDQTIDRIWNAINGKLSRIVNSVNGRTGVVVLKPNDVGLGNVDNISFEDIKKWVINKLQEEFGNKRLKLFDSLHDLDSLISLNDSVYRDTPFFSSRGYGDDKKSYIGYIYLDEGTDELKFKTKAINTVGYTDNSIIYDEEVNDTDLTGGGLGVNIWEYEDALRIYNDKSGKKNKSGLMIDKSKLSSNLLWFDGVYGDGLIDDPNALLYFDNDRDGDEAPSVKIFINDNQIIEDFKLKQTSLQEGDLIICNFKEYIEYDEGDMGYFPSGTSSSLMFRNPCIGRVNSAPSSLNPEKEFQIYFYSIKPIADWGLQYTEEHKYDAAPDGALSIKLVSGMLENHDESWNLSGLQAFSNKHPMPSEKSRHTILPQGVSKYDNKTGGLSITPDMSLCIIPYEGYSQQEYGTGSKMVENWYVDIPQVKLDQKKLHLSDTSLVGINLNKAVSYIEEDERYKFANLSGLRINNNRTYNYEDENSLGFDKKEYEGNINLRSLNVSGGLSVNVGNFLEISPGSYPLTNEEYYDGGKINVRIGQGLTGENNRIMVDIPYSLNMEYYSGGISFNQNKLVLNIPGIGNLSNPDDSSIATYCPAYGHSPNEEDPDTWNEWKGSLMVNKKKTITFKDLNENELMYDPLDNTKTSSSSDMTIELGPGLKITP